MTAFFLALVILVVLTALAGGLVFALIQLVPGARTWLSARHPPPQAPPPLPLTTENPHWTALDDQQLARYLKDSPE